MLYAHVEDGSVTYMGTLPKNWRNTSNLNKVNDSVFLKSLGWVPLIEKPATIGENEVSDGWVQTIAGSNGQVESVTSTERKRDMTKEERENVFIHVGSLYDMRAWYYCGRCMVG